MVDPIVTADGRYVILVAGPGHRLPDHGQRPSAGCSPDGMRGARRPEIQSSRSWPMPTTWSGPTVTCCSCAPNGTRSAAGWWRYGSDDPGADWREIGRRHTTATCWSPPTPWRRLRPGLVDRCRTPGSGRAAGRCLMVRPPHRRAGVDQRGARPGILQPRSSWAAPPSPGRRGRTGWTCPRPLRLVEDLPATEEFSLPPVIAERRAGRSADGTQVPMTVLRRSDLPDGPQPTLLYGYGGFDIPVLPEFRAIFAGMGGRRGRAGGGQPPGRRRVRRRLAPGRHARANKQRVFDDFIGCAESLVADGITTPAQLASTADPTAVCWSAR